MDGLQRYYVLPEPDPALTPQEVVALQVQALRHNDTPMKDGGIRTAFNFASPANRAATGPLVRFLLMVKNPIYRQMLDHRTAFIDPVVIRGDRAQARVTLVDAVGKTVRYIFILSRQQQQPYEGCWMTDQVYRS